MITSGKILSTTNVIFVSLLRQIKNFILRLNVREITNFGSH